MSNDENEEISGPMAQTEAPAETAIEPTETSPARAAGRGTLAWFALLALIVLLAVGSAGGAYYWEKNVYQRAFAGVGERIAAINGAQSAVRAGIESAEDQVVAVTAEIERLRSKIDGAAAAQTDLQRSVSALYERETQTSADWFLAEAEYLVLAATQRLALERDVETAVAALRAADQRLRSAEHPDLIPIREQIIRDMAALEAINLPDVEGWAIYLAKTIDQVDALPTKPIAEEVKAFGTVRNGEFKAEDWHRLADDVWSNLVDLVEVKDAELPDSVLFDPELRYFLRQNLKLELASARLALLRRDHANLAASAALIKGLFDAYYDVDDAAVVSIIKRLDEATALELTPPLPNISGSLDVIRKHRDSRTAAKESAR